MFVELRDSLFDVDPQDPLSVNIKPMFLHLAEVREFMRSKRTISGDADGRKKLRHYMELSWIFHMNSARSPYAQYSPDTRRDQVTRAIFGDIEWEPDDAVKKMEDLYRELTTSPIYRLLEACFNTINKAADYFDSVDFNAMTDGRMNFTTKDVFDSMAKLGKLYDSLVVLREKVEKEEEGSGGNIRKQVTVTPFNQGTDVSDLIKH